MVDDFTQIQKAAAEYFNAYQNWQKQYGAADFSQALGQSIPVIRDFETALENLPLGTPQGKLARCTLITALEAHITRTGIARYGYTHAQPKQAYTLDEHYQQPKVMQNKEQNLEKMMGAVLNHIHAAKNMDAATAQKLLDENCVVNASAQVVRPEVLMGLSPSVAPLPKGKIRTL